MAKHALKKRYGKKGQIPLKVLERRARRLASLVKARGGKV